FGWTLRVTFEQSGRPAESGGEDQAIVVRTHRAGDLVAPGSEHTEMRSSVIELIAVFFYGDSHSCALSLLDDRQQLACGFIDTYPEFSRVEICNHRGHSSEVVGMRMRDYDHVQTIDASMPEIRRDHLFAEIKVGMHPLRKSSGINQQGATLGRDQQNGIALSDVDGGH